MTKWDVWWCEVQKETSKQVRVFLLSESTSVCGQSNDRIQGVAAREATQEKRGSLFLNGVAKLGNRLV
jgi:hypothetical protein